MPITFTCPQCQKTLRVGDEHAGRQCRCPNCSAWVPVPQPQEELEPPRPSDWSPPADYVTPSVAAPIEPPPVWRWYVVYCVLMAALYLGVSVVGLFLLVAAPQLAAADPNEDALGLRIQGVILAGMGLVFITPFAIAPFLPKKPWAWVYHIVMIALGMTSVCCLPATIPLLIFWIKPETRQFFGRQ